MIDVMIIAYNEALNLPHCLKALQGWTRRVFVIDSGSTDGTPDIARSLGAEVVHHPWEGYARQKNWGLKNLPFESPWILILDADEVITPRVRDRLVDIASKPVDHVPENGFFINRITYFMGSPIRHCGFFPNWNMRFFKRGLASYEDRAVHEHMVIADPVGYIREPMIHDDRRGLEHYIAKHNRYSTLEARALFEEITREEGARDEANLARETRLRRWLKRNVMPNLPFAGMWRFVYMYFFRLGVLDGRAGLEFCKFIAMYDSLVSLKLRDLRRQAKRRGAAGTELDASPVRGLAVAEGAIGATSSHPIPLPVGEGVKSSPHAGSFRGEAAEPRRDAVTDAPTQMQPESSPWTLKEKIGRGLWMVFGRPLFRMTFHNWHGFRALILRLFGAKIGAGVAIRPTVNIEVPWMIELRDGATVGDYAILYSLGQITVGRRAIISQYAHLCAGTHDYADHTFRLLRTPITIGDDVWIGADAFIGPGVTVGDLSVVGARSSVYKSIGRKQVFVGNPAKPIKERVLR